MSSRRSRRRSPMPASSAGLLRFFEDETEGFKVRPEIVIGLVATLVTISILLRVFLPIG